MTDILSDVQRTDVLPRLPEPPNHVPPVDERWRGYRQQLVGMPLPLESQRVELDIRPCLSCGQLVSLWVNHACPSPDLPPPWRGRVRDASNDETSGGKHHLKRGQR